VHGLAVLLILVGPVAWIVVAIRAAPPAPLPASSGAGPSFVVSLQLEM